MSNRRRSKIVMRCQKENCDKQATSMVRAPHDLGPALRKDDPIFACADHVSELRIDLARAVELHERQKQQAEQSGIADSELQ